MKKYALVLLIFCSACRESKKTDRIETPATIETSVVALNLCFLSVGNEIQRENRILQDSTVLKLTIQGKKVTGTYNWIPAEKDSRKGTLKAQKTGDIIAGKYTFTQEGKQETQPIFIQLKANSATIITNKNQQGEMTIEVKEITCN